MAEVKSSELDVLSKLYKPCKTLAMSAELFFSSVLEGLALGSVSFFPVVPSVDDFFFRIA